MSGAETGIRLPAAEPPCNASHILDYINSNFGIGRKTYTNLQSTHSLLVSCCRLPW